MSSSYKQTPPRRTPPVPPSQRPVRHVPHKPASAIDDPLSLRGQVLVLSVVLTISVLLFAAVYGWMSLSRSPSAASPTGTETSHGLQPPTESTPSVPEYPSLPPHETSSKNEDSFKEEESSQNEDSSKEEESSQNEDSSKEEESSQNEDSSKEEESSQNEDSSKEEEPSQNEDSSKEESSQHEDSSKEESSEHEDSSKEEESSPSGAETLPDYLQNHEYQIMDNYSQYFGELILVNKEHQCIGNGTFLRSLMDNNDRHYAVTDQSVSLNEEAVADFDRMMDDFYAIYGDTDIMVACGFRSMAMQSGLYDSEINAVGEEEAALWVAPPGYSEHQTGYALDLNLVGNYGDGTGNISYENTPPYSWINENCSRYGFIVRYPEGRENVTGFHEEAWHFRYVGCPSARAITEYGLTLEEYIVFLRQHPAEDPLLIYTDNGTYAIYYTEATPYSNTPLLVPSDHDYTISGNNDGGFIVTVSLD